MDNSLYQGLSTLMDLGCPSRFAEGCSRMTLPSDFAWETKQPKEKQD